MSFYLQRKLDSGVRIGELHTPHGVIHTPFFMPVGTVGSVKGISPKELGELGAEIVLSNTYHLYLRPGEQLIKKLGGLHQFMKWERPILTDSGGYQVFSLGKNNFQFSIFNFQSSNNFKNLETENSLKIARQGQPEAEKFSSTLREERDRSDSNEKIENSNSLVRICEDGVEFKSHLDGSKHFFTPEKVIQIQLDLGVDILMPLDVCPSGKASAAEIKRATELTIKWAKRAKEYFDKKIFNSQFSISNQTSNSNLQNLKFNNSLKIAPKGSRREKFKIENSKAKPLLHGIIQGGLDSDLRRKCAEELVALDFDGYSVGGLAVDLETRDMWNTVKFMGEILPEDKPRYLMGVGTPDDIIRATHLGMDMFDCVLPTRLARHGSVYLKSNNNSTIQQFNNYQLINLLNSRFRSDPNPIDSNCGCEACKNRFSRAYISHLLRSNEILGLRLATLHNLYQYLELMRKLGG